MRVTINTPVGPRYLPEWAKCYCVTRHTPAYIHPYPFALPDGREIWLCPNTYHQITQLVKLYEKYSAPPGYKTKAKYTVFAQRLAKMYWDQILHQRKDEEQFNEWRAQHGADQLKELQVANLVKQVKALDNE